MLNIHNIAPGPRASSVLMEGTGSSPDPHDISGVPTPHPGHISLPPVKPRISLQDMITTSVALKSNLEVDIEHPSVPWSALLLSPSSSSPTKPNIKLPPEPIGKSEGIQLPSHVADVVSNLQHEVLLLRSELNFELWLSRENVRHIGRLHQDHVLSKNAEADRQALVRVYGICAS